MPLGFGRIIDETIVKIISFLLSQTIRILYKINLKLLKKCVEKKTFKIKKYKKNIKSTTLERLRLN